jgi:hypothetical protein
MARVWMLMLWLFHRPHPKRNRATVTFSNVVADHRVSVTFKRDKRGRN